ncbi:MAG: polysaccharide deacetylase family protein, partial [Pseudomonadota bacterium]|nr:polysaccharide deacetylase family protein [Pseudomonadota bacterium]
MNPIRQVLKLAYSVLCATGTLARVKWGTGPALLILTYHRVLPVDHKARRIEQPGMIITPESLNQHLALLRNLGGTFVRLSDWLQKAEAGKPLPRLSVAVTFDDGWQDNYQYAYPILRKHQVPATIFLVSRRINTDWQFWPERVLNLLVNHADRLDEPALAWLRAHCPDRRHAMNLIEADSVIHRLKSLDDQTIETHLEETEQALPGLTHPASDRSLLNDREILEMAESGLMEFGAHTQHHYRLNLLKDPSHL